MKRIVKLIMISLSIILMGIEPIQAETLNGADASVRATHFSVNMDVHEDGSIRVTETMNVDFQTANKRGIFVNIPSAYDMTINGQDKQYYLPVTDIEIISGGAHTVSSNSEGTQIRFGEENTFLPVGVKIYRYAYTIQLVDFLAQAGDSKMGDVFYYNIVGNNWDFPIDQVDFKITMPKVFHEKPIFYESSQGRFNNNVEGNVITGSAEGLADHKAITIELHLGQNYFKWPVHRSVWLGLGFSALITLGIVFLFWKRGRAPHVVESVEFAPPTGLSSAEIGYVYRGYTKQEDVVSLIIYWASKGLLEIAELAKDNIKLTKKAEISDTAPYAERIMFGQLFNRRDEVTTQQLKYKFGEHIQTAVANVPNRFRKNATERVYDRKARDFKILATILLPFILWLPIIFRSRDVFLGGGQLIEGVVVGGLLAVILTFVNMVLSVSLHKTRTQHVLYVILITGLMVLGMGILWLIGVFSSLLLVAGMLFVIASVITANMGMRTEQGARWYGQILGLKNFIEVAEHDRLVALVEETPEIFYNVLPYAYVLGVTNIWSKKFEDIALTPPSWYVTTSSDPFTSYYLWHSLNRNMNTISRSMSAIPASRGSGGFSSGGGFGGGGGFSGGGFGGSGGGSW